jgi:hypothetical protein
MTIQEIKKELGLTNTDLAGFFGISPMGYANSSAKPRYEAALCNFYAAVIQSQVLARQKENKTVQTTKLIKCTAKAITWV